MRKLPTTRTVRATERSPEASSAGHKRAGTLIREEPSFGGVRAQCPRCRGNIDRLECPFCGFRLRINSGIVHALPPDRAAHYACFIEDYEHIRDAEGRWDRKDEFYLNLPYKDLSARNSNQWKIRARTFDYLMKYVLAKAPWIDGGRILDIGAGNCWLSYRLTLARYRPFAIDLLTNGNDGLGAAEHLRKHVPAMFPRFQAELARLPFQDAQFDAAVFNASLHYAEDGATAMREALRCVKRGGMVIVCDTPWYSREESGRRMVAERQAAFQERYGTASDSIESLEYLTDERLQALEQELSIRWTIHSPRYGLKWAMRPFIARIRNRREPSRFRIYTARKG